MQRRCAFLALMLSLSLPAAAQRTGVTVTGTVVDQTGGVLPSAQVELLTESGTVQTTTTNQNGEFQLTGVPSGRYNLAATLEGFQPTTTRVTVGNRAPATVRITMPIANFGQEITVGNAAAAEVRADAASNLDASAVDQRTLENLPVFNDDVVGTMSRFLDSTSIGANGVMLIVNGVEGEFADAARVGDSANQNQPGSISPGIPPARPGPDRDRHQAWIAEVFRHHQLPVPRRRIGCEERVCRLQAAGAAADRRAFLGGPVRAFENTGFTLSVKGDGEDTSDRPGAGSVGVDSGECRESLPPWSRVGHADTSAGQEQHDGADGLVQTGEPTKPERRWRHAAVGRSELVVDRAGHHLQPSDRDPADAVESGEAAVRQRVRELGQPHIHTAHRRPRRVHRRRRPERPVSNRAHMTLTDIVSWSTGRHAVKFGFQIPDWSRRRFDDNTNTAGTFYFSNLADYTADRPYSFIQQAGNGHIVFLEKVLGAFAQDEIRLRPNVTVSVGLRYDWQTTFTTTTTSPRVRRWRFHQQRADGRSFVLVSASSTTGAVPGPFSRLARRKRRSANTATKARTTQIFIVSLSRARREAVSCPVRPEARSARLPGRPEAHSVRLPGRAEAHPARFPGRKRRPEPAPRPGRVVVMARLQRDRRRAAKGLEVRDHAEDLLIGEADRRLVDDGHPRIESRHDERVGFVHRLGEVLDIAQARLAGLRADIDAREVGEPKRPRLTDRVAGEAEPLAVHDLAADLDHVGRGSGRF